MDKSWIDRYFEGDLTPEEERRLKERIAHDAELRAEWEFQLALKGAIHRKERAELKSFLREVEVSRSQGKKRLWLGAAAALVLVLGMGYYFLKDNHTALAQAYFHPLPNMVSPVVRSTAAVGEAEAAFRAYEAGNYTEAIAEFKKVEKPYAHLYRGISYLALDNAEEALRYLNSFTASDADLPLETFRKWYLGLAYLEIGEKEKAKAIFEEISRYANPVQENSKSILEELR